MVVIVVVVVDFRRSVAMSSKITIVLVLLRFSQGKECGNLNLEPK